MRIAFRGLGALPELSSRMTRARVRLANFSALHRKSGREAERHEGSSPVAHPPSFPLEHGEPAGVNALLPFGRQTERGTPRSASPSRTPRS